MVSRSLMGLTATRCGSASVHAASRTRPPSPPRLHAQPSDIATCRPGRRSWPTIREHGTSHLPVLRFSTPRHFSNTARRPTPPASEDGQPARPRSSVKRTLLRWAALLAFFVAAPAIYITHSDRKRRSRHLLSAERFVPCWVVSSEPVSPTAFLLTVETVLSGVAGSDDTPSNYAVVSEAWRHGLWSVEIKQPQLQIARSYTPLPPAPGEGAPEPAGQGGGGPPHAVRLRFLVRRYDGGEVSTYLSRLGPGDVVEVRGPHLGFDVARRLGAAGRRVVFLAGGTGIAPALQAAAYLLDKGDVAVQILWANRSAAECAGCPRASAEEQGWFSSSKEPVSGQPPQEEPSAIMRQLRDLQAAYQQKAHTLEVKCAVDEEGSMLRARDITAAVVRPGGLLGQASSSCHFHSQDQLVHSTDEMDNSTGGEEIDKETSAATCTCSGGGAIGKNLFMISGPDGFVGAYVGPKVWAEGAERQGAVGGLVAELMRKDPATWRDWLVLKQ